MLVRRSKRGRKKENQIQQKDARVTAIFGTNSALMQHEAFLHTRLQLSPLLQLALRLLFVYTGDKAPLTSACAAHAPSPLPYQVNSDLFTLLQAVIGVGCNNDL